jgi:hypothetical protein
MNFENSIAWQASLAPTADDPFEKERERLRATYFKCRENARAIGDTIRDSCPGLTLHTVEHLDALWDAADLVAGNDIQLNPLEAFCFGAAVLIHDAGHSLAVFPGGLDALKKTSAWSDSAIALLHGIESDPSKKDDLINDPPEPLFGQILFNALRELHAHVAEKLAGFEIKHNRTGQSLHLIEDDQIRIHYGPVIGLIAASHHWDLDDLISRLPDKIGALAGFPREWIVDPIRLACLLRCADAIQIGSAPRARFSLCAIGP